MKLYIRKHYGGRGQKIFPQAVCKTKHSLIYIELSSLSACDEDLAIVELKSVCIAFGFIADDLASSKQNLLCHVPHALEINSWNTEAS